MVVVFLLSACGDDSSKHDLAVDMAVSPEDLSAAVDLAESIDEGVPDLTVVFDLAGLDLGPPVGGVMVTTADSTTLTLVGATAQLTATATDFDGGVLTNEGFRWRSDNSGIATVSPSGKVTAVGNGTTLIHAAAGPNNADGSISVTVAIPVASVMVSPSSKVVADTQTGTFTAAAKDSASGTIGGVTFTWSSADPTHAAVDSAGKVTGSLLGALGLGPITITATATVGGTAQVNIAVYPTWTFASGMTGATVDVDQNQYVIFKNTDTATHSVVLDAGGTLVGNFGKGDSAAKQVTLAPGSYPFHCGVHGNAMTGTLVVH